MTTTPTPEQRAYAIVQPLTVDSINRRDALMTRIITAIRDHAEPLEVQLSKLRNALIGVINRGTDGACAPDVSSDFLCFAADEAAGVKRQRDAALERVGALMEYVSATEYWQLDPHDAKERAAFLSKIAAAREAAQ